MAPAKSPLSREERKRMAAARGYAGMSHKDLGARLDVSRDTVQRAESGEATFQPHEAEAWLHRVAEACGLPYPFFTFNFAQLAEAASFSRLDTVTLKQIDALLDKRLGQFDAYLNVIEQELRRRATTGSAADRADAIAALKQLGINGDRQDSNVVEAFAATSPAEESPAGEPPNLKAPAPSESEPPGPSIPAAEPVPRRKGRGSR